MAGQSQVVSRKRRHRGTRSGQAVAGGRLGNSGAGSESGDFKGRMLDVGIQEFLKGTESAADQNQSPSFTLRIAESLNKTQQVRICCSSCGEIRNGPAPRWALRVDDSYSQTRMASPSGARGQQARVTALSGCRGFRTPKISGRQMLPGCCPHAPNRLINSMMGNVEVGFTSASFDDTREEDSWHAPGH